MEIYGSTHTEVIGGQERIRKKRKNIYKGEKKRGKIGKEERRGEG